MFDNYGFREIVAEQPKEYRYLVEYNGNFENYYSDELLKGTGKKINGIPIALYDTIFGISKTKTND